MKRPKVRPEEWTSYVAYRLRPEYRVMPEATRFQLAAFLVEVLESPHDRVDVDTYCTVGLAGDCDLLIRYVAPTPEELQEICVHVNNSGLGRHLDTPYSWLVKNHAGPDLGAASQDGEVAETPYLAVFPYRYRAGWDALDADTQAGHRKQYAEAVAAAPGIYPAWGRSLGLGPAHGVSGYQVEKLEDYEALRTTLGRLPLGGFLEAAGPPLVGIHAGAYRALELCGAL